MTGTRPPAPDGLPLLGNAVSFARDPFAFTDRAVAECGDVVRLAVPGGDRYIVAHPDLFERALVTDREAFAKTDDFRLAFGDSVLSAEGATWREQRDLLDPFFFYRRIAGYVPSMREQAVRRADSWTPGETYSMVDEMKGLTFDVLAATLLGLDPAARDGDEALRGAADDLNAYFAPASWALPDWVPTPSRRRFDRAVRTLREEVDRLLAAERGDAEASRADDGNGDGDPRSVAGEDDLLSVLSRARTAEGYPRSDADVSDQLVAILFAGHETTALALTFAWYLLARNPAVRERVEREVDDVVGDEPVGTDHLADLTLLDRVVREAMRLYPPIHTLPRVTTREVELDGYRLPEGSEVLLSVVNVHRDGRFFESPERFDPDRWGRENVAVRRAVEPTEPSGSGDVPDYAYLPFGAGPRRCVGRSFAMLEAKTVLAEVTRRYRLAWAGEGELDVVPQMTTQPAGEVPMTVRER